MERIKTSLMLPKELLPEMEDARETIGVSKSDFVAVALAFYLVNNSALQKVPRKRRKQIMEVQKTFQELVKKALENA